MEDAKEWVGLRPLRTKGVRLEWDDDLSNEGFRVLHNYGHGGSGITLSWGCAAEVVEIVAKETPLRKSAEKNN